MNREALLRPIRGLGQIALLLLAPACTGEAVTPTPAVAPVSPPATATAMPSAAPAPPVPASHQPGHVTYPDLLRPSFAPYLEAIHSRIHPIFAQELMEVAAKVPEEQRLPENLVTHLEIVLQKDTGKLVRMSVTKASGMKAFDIAALLAVDRAAPFGPAPAEIASPEGKVYLHWEFRRDPVDACSLRHVRPYILQAVP